MPRMRFSQALSLAALISAQAIFPTIARAQLGVSVTSPSEGSRAFYDKLGGWSFTVLTPFSVTALGYFDWGLDGLGHSHDVGILSMDGTLLARATVATTDPLNSFWRFASITPLTLGVGTYFIIAQQGFAADPVPDPGVSVPYALATFNPKISYGVGWSSGYPPNFPIGDLVIPSNQQFSYYGPYDLVANFVVGPAEVVPEPEVVTLLSAGLVALAGIRRRTRN